MNEERNYQKVCTGSALAASVSISFFFHLVLIISIGFNKIYQTITPGNCSAEKIIFSFLSAIDITYLFITFLLVSIIILAIPFLFLENHSKCDFRKFNTLNILSVLFYFLSISTMLFFFHGLYDSMKVLTKSTCSSQVFFSSFFNNWKLLLLYIFVSIYYSLYFGKKTRKISKLK